MLHISKYGNIRFRVSLTCQYESSHVVMLCGNKFVVKLDVLQGTETITVRTTHDTIEDAMRVYCTQIQRYESSLIYHALRDSLVAQYKGKTQELIDQHLELLTPVEKDTKETDEALVSF